MYVMSPFTSLLVLENEAMYKQFQVDRGRKDHWALYPAPQKIKVVYVLPTLATLARALLCRRMFGTDALHAQDCVAAP